MSDIPMQPARYVVKLMFEWGGGSLWGGNEAALARFDVGAIEDVLPLSHATRERLEDLSDLHDESLDRDYPPDPGPWTDEDRARFDQAVEEMRALLQAELGPEFEVVYRAP